MRAPPLRKSLEKPVFRIRNRLGAIPQTVDLSVFQRQRSSSSPRKSRFQAVRRPTASPVKKPEPLSAQKVLTNLRRRSFVKYLDEACSDEEQREGKETPLLPTPLPPVAGKESPQYRTPSVDSSNRPASIISLGPRRALYTYDSIETPYEEKESPSPARSSPKSAFKPPRPTELSMLSLRASEDLYLFRKAPATRLPARRLRKLTGGKSGSSRTGSWKAETWAVSSFLYPMSENEARTSRYSKLQQPQLRISPRATRRDRVSASLSSTGTVRVTTILPSPQTLLEQ